jgi:hypothetical protein
MPASGMRDNRDQRTSERVNPATFASAFPCDRITSHLNAFFISYKILFWQRADNAEGLANDLRNQSFVI